MKKNKAKKFHRIITSEEYQNALFEIAKQFDDEKQRDAIIRFFMSDENYKAIILIYDFYIKNQLTDSGIKFFAIKVHNTVTS